MANVKIVALGDGDTWASFGSVIELTEEDYDKLASGEVELHELYQRKAFVSEKDAVTGEEIKHAWNSTLAKEE